METNDEKVGKLLDELIKLTTAIARWFEAKTQNESTK